MSHWTIDPSLRCCDESLNHCFKSWMLWWVTEPLNQAWNAVMSHWSIDSGLGCCDQTLNHRSKSGMLWWDSVMTPNESPDHWFRSGMLWWVTEPLIHDLDAVMCHWTIDPTSSNMIQVWNDLMSHWTIDPSLGCCDESLNHCTIDPSFESFDLSLNHWSKSGSVSGML